jgi:hypothetical protein
MRRVGWVWNRCDLAPVQGFAPTRKLVGARVRFRWELLWFRADAWICAGN